MVQIAAYLNMYIHDFLLEFVEFLSMQRLGHVVCGHHISWTVPNLQISLIHLISNEEIPDVQVS